MPPGGEELARDFYIGVLRFAEIPKLVTVGTTGGVWFRTGEVELHLGVEEDFRPSRRGHPAFRVDAIDDLAESCRSGGFEVLWDARYPGVRRFYVHDPFGNRIEVMQPH